MSSQPANPPTLIPADTDTAIKVENVSKKFCKDLQKSMLYGMKDIVKTAIGMNLSTHILRADEFWALDDISFELKRGEALGIIGHNGSGKTTLLSLLNGIFLPDKGKVEIKGKVGALIDLGAGFHPMLTGRENVYINGAVLGMSEQEIADNFNSIVEFADIGDFLDAPVKNYSSGMFIRLGFAIAIHSNPDILLLDEILAVGDSSFRRKSSERMKEFIKDNNRTIVLVSHNMASIEAIARKTILLNKGKILAYGDTKDIIPQYDILMRPKAEEKTITSKSVQVSKGELTLVSKYEGYGGDEIIIKKVWLQDDEGKTKNTFYSNENLTLFIEYQWINKIPNAFAILDIVFLNEWDVNCIGSQVRSGIGEEFASLPEKGVLKVRFSPIQLATSHYKIAITFQDQTYDHPFYQGHYGYLTVLSQHATINVGSSTPICYPPAQWELIKN